MKQFVTTFFALLFSVVCFAGETQETQSAVNWLAVIDSGEYAKSWEQAAPFFQSQLSSQQWVQALDQVRTPLGKLRFREIEKAAAHHTLPGAPKGKYMMIKFTSQFEHKPSAIETLTMQKVGQDWRAVGYFIK